MRNFAAASIAALFALPALIAGQLSGTVGPLTTIAQKKATKTCDVTNYGAKADKTTDLGPPLASAWAACVKGGVVVIPAGDYVLSTWTTLNGGNKIAIQLDGTIYRGANTAGGNMILVKRTTDFELFSSTSKGAMQGLGYELHKSGNYAGARLLRLTMVDNFSVHDIALTDAPMFHFVIDTCTNGEVYNMAIRGGNSGGLDGIDVFGTNIWIHDVMVTNRDECVTVKSPSKNLLIENVYCNWSGGCALGSLGTGTDISNVVYRNVYTINSNQMLMIKSNGGSGSVKNVAFENFIGRGNAYSLDVDQYWSSMSTIAGSGVQLNNLTFSGWRGTAANGKQRGTIKMACADGAPCTDITIKDFAMWTESGTIDQYTCRSAYGSGACLKNSGDTAYAMVTSTIKTAPAGYTAASMKEDLATNFGTSLSIPIPTIPASFYPGVAPISKLMAKRSDAVEEAVSTPVSIPAVASQTVPAQTETASPVPATSFAISAKPSSCTKKTGSAPVATDSVATPSHTGVRGRPTNAGRPHGNKFVGPRRGYRTFRGN